MYAPPPLPAGGPVALFGAGMPFQVYGFSDGSVKRYTGSCASVILDETGKVLTQTSRLLSGHFVDSNEAEFQGLLDALSSASLTKARSLWLGVDCFEVVSHVLKQSVRYERYLQALRELLSRFEHVTIQSIARKHNKEADRLAHQCILNIR